jgi:hypothetical protein
VRIPQLLDASLLEFLRRRLGQCRWKLNPHSDPAGELGLDDVTEDPAALHLLYFVCNFPEFRALIHEVTGCGPLTVFRGRRYRKIAGGSHYNKWHSDNVDNRVVAMSIKLSRGLYDGGLLEMRKAGSAETLLKVANTELGDALLFRISDELEHRVTDVEGTEAKTAFAGWFRYDRPEFLRDIMKPDRKDIDKESIRA